MADNDSVIAHGGVCPKGYIYDHNKSSDTYGRCIPIWKKLASRPAGSTVNRNLEAIRRRKKE